jgi:hypothetical protein
MAYRAERKHGEEAELIWGIEPSLSSSTFTTPNPA